jgi:hypothetical protein
MQFCCVALNPKGAEPQKHYFSFVSVRLGGDPQMHQEHGTGKLAVRAGFAFKHFSLRTFLPF